MGGRLRTLLAAAAAVAAAVVDAAVMLKVNGAVVTAPGSYARAAVSSFSLDTGVARFSFSSSFEGSSVVVNGSELLVGATSASFYVDAAGNNYPSWVELRVLRVNVSDLVEVALIDSNASTPLRYELHYVARAGVPGLYGYMVLAAVANAGISEVRHNTRWNRCKLFRAVSSEREGIPPLGELMGTAPYGYTVQDSTWNVTGIPAPSLPCPDTNLGSLPDGYGYPYVWSKYMYSLYHAENPLFGFAGTDPGTNQSVGTFLTPLMGVTDATSAATYGGGPLHQDLAVHHDSIICNYVHRNHYGSVGEQVTAGWSRLFRPWLHTVLTRRGTARAAQDAVVAAARAIAQAEIAASLPGLPWMADARYAPPGQRLTVTGRVVIGTPGDTRPPDQLWVLLSQEAGADNVHLLNAPTYFVRAAANGSFALPGIPPGVWSLYVFPSGGAMTGLGRWDGLALTAGSASGVYTPPAAAGLNGGFALPPVNYTPAWRPVFLWSVGATDGEGGEFGLGNSTREWDLPARVPGDVDFTIGTSWEPADWWYAQTNAGVWTVRFTLTRSYAGTAYLTVASSLQQYTTPTVRVNGGRTGVTGTPPSAGDSTLSRQAVRSGVPRSATLTIDPTRFVVGVNTITFDRGAGGNGQNSGMGYDAVVLEVDEGGAWLPPPVPPVLSLTGVGYVAPSTAGGANTANASTTWWDLVVANAAGAGPARQVVIEGVSLLTPPAGAPAAVAVAGRDPARFAVPLAEELPGGTSTSYRMQVSAPAGCPGSGSGSVSTSPQLAVTVAANGRRQVARTTLPFVCASSSPTATTTASPTATLSNSATTTPLRGVSTFCPAAGLAQVPGIPGRCLGVFRIGSPYTWYTAEARCANLAPGARLATVTSAADGQFVVRGLCGLVSSAAVSVAIGLYEPSGAGTTNRSCCWSWVTPVVSAPGADGSTVTVVDRVYTEATYLRSPEGQALWQGSNPSGGRPCGTVWKPTSNASDAQGVDDASCWGGLSYACCEAPLTVVTASPTGSLSWTPTGSPTGSVTPSRSGSATRMPTGTGSLSATVPPSESASGTRTSTPATTPSTTPTATPPLTPSLSAAVSASGTPVPTASPPATATATGTRTGSPAATPSGTPTVTPSGTPAATPTGTSTVTPSGTPAATPTGTLSPSASASPPVTRTGTGSGSASGTGSPSGSATSSRSRSASKSRLPTTTRTSTPSQSRSVSGTATRTRSRTRSRTRTRTPSKSAGGASRSPSASRKAKA